MPFTSKKQVRWAFANRAKLAREGMDVDQWAKETNFKSLPLRAKKKKMEGK